MTTIYRLPWHTLHWRTFEKLVYAYFFRKFGDLTWTVVSSTSAGGPDGGRDIEIKVEHPLHHSTTWIECKHHQRPIGLASLGKYLVVVIVNNVQQLFVVSTSRVTDPAKAQFAAAAARNNLNVFFVDGSDLAVALCEFPELLRDFFPDASLEATTDPLPVKALAVKCLLPTGTAGSESSTLTPFAPLQEQFLFSILLRSNADRRLHDLSYQLHNPADSAVAIHVDPATAILPPVLLPTQSTVIRFHCHVKHRFGRPTRPRITFDYLLENDRQVHEISLPPLNLAALRQRPPLVGQQAISFRGTAVPTTLDRLTAGQPQLLLVRGSSGVGKSRLLAELRLAAIRRSLNALAYDAAHLHEKHLLRNLLCDLLSLPLIHGQLLHTVEDFEALLRARGCRDELTADVSQFLANKAAVEDSYYPLVETLKHALRSPRPATRPVILLDNIQELSPAGMELLEELVAHSLESSCPVCFALVVNQERVVAETSRAIAGLQERLLHRLASQPELGTSVELAPLDEGSARLLVQQLVPAAKANYQICTSLLGRTGTRPLDIEMAVGLLEDQKVLFWSSDGHWEVPDTRRFSDFVRRVPRELKAVISGRLVLVANNFDSQLRRDAVWKLYRLLVAFGGDVPLSVLSDQQILAEALSHLVSRSLLKVNDSGTSVVPYHDNIQQVLLDDSAFSPTLQDAQRALTFLQDRTTELSELWRLAILLNKMRAGYASAEVVSDAIEVVAAAGSSQHSLAAISGAEQAIAYAERLMSSAGDPPLPLLELRLVLADALVHESDLSKGLAHFDILYRQVRTIAHLPSAFCTRYFHNAVNANLHAQRYQRALGLLEEHRVLGPADLDAEFRIHNRLGVALTACGDADRAIEELDAALALAAQHERWDLAAVALYDLGYVDVHVTHSKEAAKKCFQEALLALERAGEVSLYRRIEQAQMRGFIALLEGDCSGAIASAEEGLWIARRHHQVYYAQKLLLLRSAGEILSGRFERGAETASEARARSAHYGNERAYWRATANLGAALYLSEDKQRAALCFHEAESKIRQRLEDAFARELPIIYNALRIAVELQDVARTNELLEQWPDQRLAEAACTVASRPSPDDAQDLYVGIVGAKGLALLMS